MPIVRAQLAWTHDSGLPEDAIVNTFHFDCPVDDTATAESIAGALDRFYNVAALSQPVRAYMSSELSGTGQLKLYNLPDPEPRIPWYTTAMAIVPGTGAPLPEEVALCASFQGDPVSGVNPARRRGRIFIGPLNVDVMSGGGVNVSATDNIAASAERILADLAADGNLATWVVYSRANDPLGNGSGPVAEVTNGWVDNAFDTQRRRGTAPTARALWP